MSRVSLLPEGAAEVLDRYQLIGEIASGGMATVYLARLPGVGGFSRMVAIKRLHPHLANDQRFVEMFLDEARLAASIHHRNVVPILEIGSSEHGYYLVMEYIEGVTLAKMMTYAAVTGEMVPSPILLRIVLDTLSGLHAAHELTDDNGEPLSVVHRDCTPQNILVGLDGCARLTDFGVARARSRLHQTQDGAMKGKLAYLAPEQTSGEDFDRRADVFSMGVVLWEILAQKRLFKGKTEAETLRRLLHDPVPSLIEVAPGTSEELDSVCKRALARDPAHRFASAASMADALERAVSREHLATERTVESFMQDRYGTDLSENRDAVRSWLQATPTNLGQSSPGTDRGWLMGERPSVSGVQPQGTGAGRQATSPSSAPPSTPVGEDAPSATSAPPVAEEQTGVYDPTTDDVVAAPIPPTVRSPDPPSRRGGIVVVVALLALCTAGFLVVRSMGLIGGTTNPEGAADPAAAVEPGAGAPEVEPTPEPRADPAPAGVDADPEGEPATAPATEPEAAPEPVKPTLRPGPRPVAPSPKPTAEPVAKPPPEAEPKPAPPPPPPPPPPPDEGSDLSNPYR